jgi:hypothetical protein
MSAATLEDERRCRQPALLPFATRSLRQFAVALANVLQSNVWRTLGIYADS